MLVCVCAVHSFQFVQKLSPDFHQTIRLKALIQDIIMLLFTVVRCCYLRIMGFQQQLVFNPIIPDFGE